MPCRARSARGWLVCAGVFLSALAGPLAAAAEAGDTPRYRIETLAGRVLTPATQQGRVLVLNIWATWCGPCRKEMPVLDAFQAKYQRRGVDVVAVSVDDRDEVDAVHQAMAAYSFPAALAVASDLRALGRIRQVPATFVIDRNGVLRRDGWQEAGAVDMETLEKAVKPLLAPPAAQ